MSDDAIQRQAIAIVTAVRDVDDPPQWAVDFVAQSARALIADELRAAADEAHDEYSGWEAANVVRARANELDPA